MEPADRRGVAEHLELVPGVMRERQQRIAVQRAAVDRRQPLVEELRQRAQEPRLRLPAQAEQDEVVPRQERVDDLGLDGVLVADDAGEELAPRAEARDDVVAQLVLHGAVPVAGGFELAEGAGAGHGVTLDSFCGNGPDGLPAR